MVSIVNITDPADYGKPIHRYEMRINEILLATVEHDPIDGLPGLLRILADDMDIRTSPPECWPPHLKR